MLIFFLPSSPCLVLWRRFWSRPCGSLERQSNKTLLDTALILGPKVRHLAASPVGVTGEAAEEFILCPVASGNRSVTIV